MVSSRTIGGKPSSCHAGNRAFRGPILESLVKNRLGLFFAESVQFFFEIGALEGQNGDGEKGGVDSSSFADRQGADGDSGGHLDGGSRESMPRSIWLSMGTPRTGKRVWAARTPARC